MTKGARVQIAYVLKGFPRFSETFIANEIFLLERMGLNLRLFSVKAGDTGKRHEVVSRIRARVDYLPEVTSISQCALTVWLYHNVRKFVDAHRKVLHLRPRAYLETLWQALSMSWKYRVGFLGKPRKVFIKEFLQAGYIASEVLSAPEIHHLHGHFCHGAATITWFVSRITGIPFSFTAHAKDIYQKKLNPGDLLARKLAAARFVATCTGANFEHLSGLLPESRTIHTIYHGLDTGVFSPSPVTPKSATTPLVVSVGRLVEKKGFAYLIEACVQLKQRGLKFRCAIVGEKDEQFDVLRRMIDALDLRDRVSLRGPMPQAELRDLYRQATMFVLPCQIMDDGDRDGIPNVLAEAMATGLPVVSTRISGIPELVRDGVEGILVRQRDTDALARAMEGLLREPELRAAMGIAARERICRCFDSNKTTSALRDLFLKTLGVLEAAA